MNKTLLGSALCLLATVIQLSAQKNAPERFQSPAGDYAIEILQKPMPKADTDVDFFTLVLWKNKKPLTRVPTYGYLTSAYWSGDGKYVAVNNRRGNSGDYVWVFHLPDGRILKMPGDRSGEGWQRAADEAVAKNFPSVSGDDFIRCWVTATGWKGNELRFVVRSIYRSDKDAFDFEGTAEPMEWSITSSKVVKKRP